jgi:iron(III) transport system ATP-binding protein
LLDEPFSNLDRVHEHILESVIHKIGKQLKITLILVSHEPLEILSWADKILIMRNGTVVQKGPPEKIYRQPVNEYAAGLLGKYNLLTVEQAKLFFSVKSEAGKKKTLLVRPENFKLVPRDKKGVAGKVVRSHFFGSYFELEILVKDVTVTVKSASRYEAGDKVFIALHQKDGWFI